MARKRSSRGSTPVSSRTIARTASDSASSAPSGTELDRGGLRQRLDVGLDRVDLGERRVDLPLDRLGDVVRGGKRERARELQVEGDLQAVVDLEHGDVVHLAHAGDTQRRGGRALPQLGRLGGLDVDDDVGARDCALDRLLDGVGRGVALARRPRRGERR